MKEGNTSPEFRFKNIEEIKNYFVKNKPQWIDE